MEYFVKYLVLLVLHIADDKVSIVDEDELPSLVTDRQYIYMKDRDMTEEDYMQEGGKWMIFANGDMQKQDEHWLALKPLYRNGTVTSLKASTAFNSEGGVINCYTPDAENWMEVRKAAEAIRDVVDYKFIMYYKTNDASVKGLYINRGARSISKYMFTVMGEFYKKDEYNRWEWIKEAH